MRFSVILVFYALFSFASNSLFSASTVLSKNRWLSCYGKSFPDELIVKISLHLIPDFKSPIHPEKIVENVYQLMQYRSVCKQVMHVVDQSIINTITLKKMYYWFCYENRYCPDRFFKHYRSYLNTGSSQAFFGRFAELHKSEEKLLSCFFEQKEPYGKWYQGGHRNEYEPWESLAKEGIVLGSFSQLLDFRQFVLWKKLFELAKLHCNYDKRALIIMADQYCDYVEKYGKIGDFFDKWHDDCVSLVAEKKIPNQDLNEIDDLNEYYFDKLKKIKAYFDCHSWLPLKKYSDLMLSFDRCQKNNDPDVCYLIASVLSKVPLDRPILNESKKFLQLLKVLNQNLFHPSLTAQPVNYPLLRYDLGRFQAYFVGNFYYELVQELGNDNFFITPEILERQWRFMQEFFSRYKPLFSHFHQKKPNYGHFLKTLLSFDPFYYYDLVSDDKGINQSLPFGQKSEERLLQLQRTFYGFKFMLLHSFIVSINLPLVFALGQSDDPFKTDRYYIAKESKLRTLFEKECVPFFYYIDNEKAHFLKEFFKDTAINAHLPNDPGIEQQPKDIADLPNDPGIEQQPKDIADLPNDPGIEQPKDIAHLPNDPGIEQPKDIAHLPNDPGIEQPKRKKSLLQKIIKLIPKHFVIACFFSFLLGFIIVGVIENSIEDCRANFRIIKAYS